MYFCFNSISMKHIIHSFLLIAFISCSPINKKENLTYFGGEIINPKDKFVLLLKDDQIIDTLELNSQNRFIAQYENFSEGLYTFKHGIEFQYVYILNFLLYFFCY